MTWDQMLEVHRVLGDKRRRVFALMVRRSTKLAALAHPATGGNECLCHNWGNERARAAWASGWRRWRAYSARIDALSRAAWDSARNPARG